MARIILVVFCFFYCLLSPAGEAFAAKAAAGRQGCLPPECMEFPADSGAINVRDFGAKGDGINDDTDAINRALSASGSDTKTLFWKDKIVYFPAGTYLVSAPLNKRYAEGRFASGAVMIGKSPTQTIIKLKDNAEGYNDPNSPKAVIFTSAKLLDGNATSGGKDYNNKGEGNDAYNNFIENMTIDVGEGNPGAIGIDYLANNLGAIRNVLVKAGSGSGATGIALTRKWPGPALISNVTVEGFDKGIEIDHTEYGMTFDNVKLRGQRSIGLLNNHNVVSAYNLQVSGAPQPLINNSPDGLTVLVGGSLDNGGSGPAEAYVNNGVMNIRNTRINGQVTDGIYEQDKLLSPSFQSWSLPVKQAPQPEKDAVKNWVAVRALSPENDATEAIRKAFASGASTIYFPNGIYSIGDNIVIPPSVKWIVGMGSTIRAVKQRSPGFARELGFFRITSDGSPLVIDHLSFDNSSLGRQVAVESSGRRSVVLRDIIGAGVTTLKRTENGGEAFLENTCCGLFDFAGSAGIWAKQLNTEGGITRIVNNGSPLWVLGLKTERNCTILENKNGAYTEILGGLVYMVHEDKNPLPAFRNSNSRLFLSYAEEAFNPKATYSTHLIDIKDGEESEITADMLPKRNKARMVPGLASK